MPPLLPLDFASIELDLCGVSFRNEKKDELRVWVWVTDGRCGASETGDITDITGSACDWLGATGLDRGQVQVVMEDVTSSHVQPVIFILLRSQFQPTEISRPVETVAADTGWLQTPCYSSPDLWR